ncbi:MAG: hypothetical protein KGJ80_14705 [Chloroflexota bacterium]|nr:hypothetical protein [Chloroflexota bacterium]
MDSRMRVVPSPVGSLLVGFYGWIVIAFFGAVLLDTVYAKTIRDVLDSVEAATVFSEASDFLLVMVALAALAALGAIGSSWQSTLARNLFVASGVLVIAEPLAPIALRPLLLESNAGLWLRLVLSATASVLGLLGLYKFYLRS